MLLARLISVVHEYLSGATSLEDLEDWVAARFRSLFSMPDPATTDLAAAIELGLAEIGDGVLNEDEFRDRLRAAVQQAERIAITTRETMLDWSPSRLVAAIPVPSNASIQAMQTEADSARSQQWLTEILRNDRSDALPGASPPPGNTAPR